jgi:hypothetical protein
MISYGLVITVDIQRVGAAVDGVDAAVPALLDHLVRLDRLDDARLTRVRFGSVLCRLGIV